VRSRLFVLVPCLFACVRAQAPKEEPMTTAAPASFAISRPVDAALPAPERGVVDAVRAFAAAADARDLTAMEALLDGGFQIAFTVKGSGEVSALSRAVYLSLLKEGKAGGLPRRVEVLAVAVDGALARATAVLESDAARFESAYTLARRDGRWILLQDATVFAPRR
jgi:hypothetical protein